MQMRNTPLCLKRFIQINLIWLLVLLAGWSLNAGAQPLNATLHMQPEQCVSLRQGQMCYAKVTLHWQTNTTDNFCLFSSQSEQPLRCWQSRQQGYFEGEIAGKESVLFHLRLAGDSANLASAELKMAWVYKRKRPTVSWRVF